MTEVEATMSVSGDVCTEAEWSGPTIPLLGDVCTKVERSGATIPPLVHVCTKAKWSRCTNVQMYKCTFLYKSGDVQKSDCSST